MWKLGISQLKNVIFFILQDSFQKKWKQKIMNFELTDPETENLFETLCELDLVIDVLYTQYIAFKFL